MPYGIGSLLVVDRHYNSSQDSAMILRRVNATTFRPTQLAALDWSTPSECVQINTADGPTIIVGHASQEPAFYYRHKCLLDRYDTLIAQKSDTVVSTSWWSPNVSAVAWGITTAQANAGLRSVYKTGSIVEWAAGGVNYVIAAAFGVVEVFQTDGSGGSLRNVRAWDTGQGCLYSQENAVFTSSDGRLWLSRLGPTKHAQRPVFATSSHEATLVNHFGIPWACSSVVRT